MKVRTTRDAASDLVSARRYDAATDPVLRERFLDDFDVMIERIVVFPDSAPPVEGFSALRRTRMRRFPYGVFYTRAGAEKLIACVYCTPDAITRPPLRAHPPDRFVSAVTRCYSPGSPEQPCSSSSRRRQNLS